jgi:hypothetical protein
MSDRLSRRAAVLSVASVLLMLLVAAGTVALVRVEPDVLARVGMDAKRLPYWISGVAVLAAVAVVAQSLGRFEARAEAHRAAANAYRALQRAMAATLATPRSARRAPDTELNDVRERFDRYAERSPAIGSRAARRASLALEEDRPASSLRLGREVPDPLV